MHQATQILRQEHEVILGVLNATENTASALEAGSNIPADVLQETVEFLRRFADTQHHGKEEEHLFPKLRQCMPMAAGPVSTMLMEHQIGRSHIARMAEAAKSSAEGNRAAGAEWADAALDYAAFLREHIYKENNILFAMAEQVLTQDEQQQLASAFTEVDAQKIGEPLAKRLLQIAGNLRSQTVSAGSQDVI
ncbi:MAG TPA: hemerythrin domain-containing protein [Terriglobales bacterium]|nr:hemerythrin domain-containing protein [Terriglobales bacterium]